MGGIGGMMGLGGGAAGTGFGAPAQADIERGVSTGQTAQSFDQNQEALAQQQRLVGALQGQGGLQNQSNVFGQFQGLAGQYQDVAAGKGPNPAQAMLNQQTGANVQNQAALMAGQRGAGANVGLMARQAGMHGANTQQQAVGQGATMQANQSLNALGQVGGALGQAGTMANTQASNQIGATAGMTSAQQSQQANLLNALNAQNTARVGSQSSVNAGNAGLANTQLQGQQAVIGGGANILGGGGVKAMMPSAHGGMVPNYDEGGEVSLGADTNLGNFEGPPQNSNAISQMDTTLGNPQFGQSAPGAKGDAFSQANLGVNTQMPAISQGPASSFGQFASKVDSGGAAPQASPSMGADSGAEALYQGIIAGPGSAPATGPKVSSMASMAAMASQGGLVDVIVSPGEKIIPPDKVEKAAKGKVEAKTVPGKAKVSGDDYANDTVPKKLPAGTVIVPRTSSKNDRDSASFVRSVLAKRGKK